VSGPHPDPLSDMLSKPTRHILAQMQRIRIDNLRAFKEANHA